MMNQEFLDDIRKGVQDMAKGFKKDLREGFKGVPFGHKRPTDVGNEEFLDWFAVRAFSDPYWVSALAYVEGGDEPIDQYFKLRDIDRDSINVPIAQIVSTDPDLIARYQRYLARVQQALIAAQGQGG